VARAGDLLVTAEGVVLDLETAGVASRVLARALDLLVCAVGLYAVLMVLAVTMPPLWVMIVAITIAVFVALFLYPLVLETALSGRTVGKLATGLRVVTDVGAPIRFRHAATRSALSVVDLLATSGFAGIASMLASPRHQRLGDVAAGTIVVRTRLVVGRSGSTRLLGPPSGYDSFIGSLDVAGIDRERIHLAREILARSTTQSLVGLSDQAAHLAAAIDADLGSRRPARMADAVFLQCVVAADAQGDDRPRPLARVGSTAAQ